MKRDKILLSDTNIIIDFLNAQKHGKECLKMLGDIFDLKMPREVVVEVERKSQDFNPRSYNISVHETTTEEREASKKINIGRRKTADQVCCELFFRNAILKKNEGYHLASRDKQVFKFALKNAEEAFGKSTSVHRTFGLLRILIINNKISNNQAFVLAYDMRVADKNSFLDAPFAEFIREIFINSEPPDVRDAGLIDSIRDSIVYVRCDDLSRARKNIKPKYTGAMFCSLCGTTFLRTIKRKEHRICSHCDPKYRM